MYFSRKNLFILFFIYLTINLCLSCCAVENDLGSWNGVSINTPITEKIHTKFYVSPRLLDNYTDFSQLILHGLLGYKFNKHFSIWQGYAWSRTYIPGLRREHRPYNDFIYENVFKNVEVESRIRFEERFLQDTEGVSLRLRYKLKGSYPIDKEKKWRVVLFDEIFTNLNSHYDGPQAGLDQNRIYIGLNRKINELFNIDAGYQLQHQHKKGKDNDTLNHFILFNLNFTLPQILKN